MQNKDLISSTQMQTLKVHMVEVFCFVLKKTIWQEAFYIDKMSLQLSAYRTYTFDKLFWKSYST